VCVFCLPKGRLSNVCTPDKKARACEALPYLQLLPFLFDCHTHHSCQDRLCQVQAQTRAPSRPPCRCCRRRCSAEQSAACGACKQRRARLLVPRLLVARAIHWYTARPWSVQLAIATALLPDVARIGPVGSKHLQSVVAQAGPDGDTGGSIHCYAFWAFQLAIPAACCPNLRTNPPHQTVSGGTRRLHCGYNQKKFLLDHAHGIYMHMPYCKTKTIALTCIVALCGVLLATPADAASCQAKESCALGQDCIVCEEAKSKELCTQIDFCD
jgi:hypothetical protein